MCVNKMTIDMCGAGNAQSMQLKYFGIFCVLYFKQRCPHVYESQQALDSFHETHSLVLDI